jgi:hypothetical protein
MKLTIDRQKWGRGASGGSLLELNSGKMCCLGFLGLACGLKEDQIKAKAMPHEVKEAPTKNKTKWKSMIAKDDCGTFGNSSLASKLANINDAQGTTDKQKEQAIKRQFKKIDIDVTFEN